MSWHIVDWSSVGLLAPVMEHIGEPPTKRGRQIAFRKAAQTLKLVLNIKEDITYIGQGYDYLGEPQLIFSTEAPPTLRADHPPKEVEL